MKTWVFLTFVWLAACSQGDGANAGDADATADTDHVDAPDAAVDTAVPDPPEALAPCEATQCRESVLGGPPCSSSAVSDTFTGEFGVHAYSSMAWDGALTKIRVDATSGDWTPVIVLARLNGEVLFDGDVGAVRPPFDVVATSPADIVLTTSQATGIVVYVTSTEALASGFDVGVPVGAGYDLTLESDCGGERLRCVVNGRDTGEPECGWLHYIGKRVMARLAGPRDERLSTAARVGWWSLKEGLMANNNPIVRSICDGAELGPLDDCAGQTWTVGLSDVAVQGQTVEDLEELAARLYDGAMASGVLRSTANQAALARDDAAAVMETSDALRASWLLRNSAIGFTIQEPWVSRTCIDASGAECFGSGSEASRFYAANRGVALRSIDDLQSLFDQLGE